MRFRPLDAWPKGELTPPEARRPSPFEATYDATLDLLDYELNRLGVTEVVVQVAVGDRGVRVDGGLRADARPDHPGVVVSYTDPRQGPLVFATDRFSRWQANLRAIALGLEALRKVDRYGITTKGEQYTGWKELPSGIPMGPGAEPEPLSPEKAAQIIVGTISGPHDAAHNARTAIEDRDFRSYAYRQAAKRLHPDVGGSPEAFRRLNEAKAVLDGLDSTG